MSLSLRKASKQFFDWFAGRLVTSKVSANEVSLCGFVIGIWAFMMLAYNQYASALIFILINRFFDGLDGAVARQTKETEFGHYLDIVLDFIFYCGLFFFFAVGQPQLIFPVLMIVVAFAINHLTMTAFTIFAVKKKFKKNDISSLYLLGGLMDGTENFALIVFMCIAPGSTSVNSVIYFLLAIFASLSRIVTARKYLDKGTVVT